MEDQKELIDEYIRLISAKNLIEKNIKDIRAKLQLDKGRYQGINYELEVSEVPSYTYDNAKLYKKLGRETFINIATLPKKELINYISEEQLNKMVKDVKISLRFSKYDEEKAKKYAKEG